VASATARFGLKGRREPPSKANLLTNVDALSSPERSAFATLGPTDLIQEIGMPSPGTDPLFTAAQRYVSYRGRTETFGAAAEGAFIFRVGQ
jgi:hypothetical protein